MYVCAVTAASVGGLEVAVAVRSMSTLPLPPVAHFLMVCNQNVYDLCVCVVSAASVGGLELAVAVSSMSTPPTPPVRSFFSSFNQRAPCVCVCGECSQRRRTGIGIRRTAASAPGPSPSRVRQPRQPLRRQQTRGRRGEGPSSRFRQTCLSTRRSSPACGRRVWWLNVFSSMCLMSILLVPTCRTELIPTQCV